MSPLVIDIKAGGPARKMRAMALRAQDATLAWPQVGAYLSRTVQMQFATNGTHLKTPWQPLRPDYRLWKVRNGYPRAILVMTGDLKRSFVSRPMDIERYSGNRAQFGSNERTAIWHHYGTRRNGKRVNPPRPILKATRGVRSDVRDILKEYVVDGKIT